MRIAFASSDGKNINCHFGTARCFEIWEVQPTSAVAIERILPGPACQRNDQRLVIRAGVLDGCTLVYATEIGNPAAAKLIARGIQPIRTCQPARISDTIAALQAVLAGNPPPWLRRHTSPDLPK